MPEMSDREFVEWCLKIDIFREEMPAVERLEALAGITIDRGSGKGVACMLATLRLDLAEAEATLNTQSARISALELEIEHGHDIIDASNEAVAIEKARADALELSLGQVRAEVEKAPHGLALLPLRPDWCECDYQHDMNITVVLGYDGKPSSQPRPCNCWKYRALALLAPSPLYAAVQELVEAWKTHRHVPGNFYNESPLFQTIEKIAVMVKP
jgi:hypothetical protein